MKYLKNILLIVIIFLTSYFLHSQSIELRNEFKHTKQLFKYNNYKNLLKSNEKTYSYHARSLGMEI